MAIRSAVFYDKIYNFCLFFHNRTVGKSYGVAVVIDFAEIVKACEFRISREIPGRACGNEYIGVCFVRSSVFCIRNDFDGARVGGIVSEVQVDIGNRVNDDIAA